MKKKIVLFLCIMGIMAVLTGCASSSKEIYTPQNIQEKKAKKVADKFVKKVQKEDYKDIKSYIFIFQITHLLKMMMYPGILKEVILKIS